MLAMYLPVIDVDHVETEMPVVEIAEAGVVTAEAEGATETDPAEVADQIEDREAEQEPVDKEKNAKQNFCRN